MLSKSKHLSLQGSLQINFDRIIFLFPLRWVCMVADGHFWKKNYAKLSKVLLISICYTIHYHHYHNHFSEPEGKQGCCCDSHVFKELNCILV